VTCSLDKTIKTWDINSISSEANPEPKTCIQTTYPVWRARNLPFGEGVLSLPQRGETNLEMYGKGGDLIETFEGHSDVVKEFVWRKGNNGICIIDVFVILILISFAGDFQLITWSKDRTLRFWPIDGDVMHVCAFCHSTIEYLC
jgi:WD40 repeat protein